jgi:hypothetical protein
MLAAAFAAAQTTNIVLIIFLVTLPLIMIFDFSGPRPAQDRHVLVYRSPESPSSAPEPTVGTSTLNKPQFLSIPYGDDSDEDPHYTSNPVPRIAAAAPQITSAPVPIAQISSTVPFSGPSAGGVSNMVNMPRAAQTSQAPSSSARPTSYVSMKTSATSDLPSASGPYSAPPDPVTAIHRTAHQQPIPVAPAASIPEDVLNGSNRDAVSKVNYYFERSEKYKN